MMIEQEKDPSYQYAIHQKEFALPEHFRGDFLGAYDKFAECDPHDLPAVEKALNENKEQLASWVAMAMWHIERLSPSHFSPEEIQKREDVIQRVWEEKGWKADDLIDIATKRMPEVLPRWASLLLLANYPLEKETLSEDKKRELTAFVFESVDSVSKTSALGAELVQAIGKGRDYFSPEEKQKHKARMFPGGILEQEFSTGGVRTRCTVGDKEFSYDTINLWRLLQRRGLTRWKEFLGPEDQERTREELEQALKTAITNELAQGKPSKTELRRGHWSPPEGFSPDTRAILQQRFKSGKLKLQEDIAVTPERKMVSVRLQPKFGEAEEGRNLEPGNSLLQFGWHDMPESDLRLSFEIPKALSVEQQVGETLDKPLKAIVDAAMDGLPISCKITASDFGGSGSKRLMVYADYSTAQELIARLKDLGYAKKGQPAVEKKGEQEYLFPFGGPRVHVRGSGEAKFSGPIVHHQLELLKTVK